jgi:hypothetical protein
MLVEAIEKVTEAQKLVKKIGEELNRQDTINRLRKCHEGDRDEHEAFESDCSGLDMLKVSSASLHGIMGPLNCDIINTKQEIIAKQNMQDDSSASLANLQLAVGKRIPCRADNHNNEEYVPGAAYDITNDLTALTEYIAENTEPGPGPLLRLEENQLLQMWSDLAVEGMSQSLYQVSVSYFTNADSYFQCSPKVQRQLYE